MNGFIVPKCKTAPPLMKLNYNPTSYYLNTRTLGGFVKFTFPKTLEL